MLIGFVMKLFLVLKKGIILLRVAENDPNKRLVSQNHKKYQSYIGNRMLSTSNVIYYMEWY